MRHLATSISLKGPDDIRMEVMHRRNHTILSIITRDRPGLFSLLTGVLALSRIDIISAQIFTWYDSTVVDTFRVLPPWQDYQEWDKLEELFKDCLSGKIDFETKLTSAQKLKNDEDKSMRGTGRPVLLIDNETSDFFTIIEVRAHKRTGLIHDISRSISSSGLEIHRAFLSRNSDLLSSVFYVVDSVGEKILDAHRQQEILTLVGTSIDSRA